jgi:class 3 adenylate cyclase/tetratricopeptide (TPR) repeat protein
MSSPSGAIGRTLSHYRILEHIGSGGMGVVYRAHDEQLERDVAIKVLPPGTLTDEDARRRFRKEALALAKLNHPNIETVHEFGSQDGIDFLVTEYIPGVSLDEKLIDGYLDEKQILGLGVQLADGLDAAHQQNVVHRDLKPANLRITGNGRLKILDFGLARLVDPESDPSLAACLTQQPEIRGTLPYMAPERLRGKGNDLRSDIWAAGAVLYEMATGQRPFTQVQSAELITAILSEKPTSPRELNLQISPALESTIIKALEKELDRRHQSAAEMRSELEGVGIRTSTTYRSTTVGAPRPARQTPTLEIAHVLFMDVVAYSMMPMEKQQTVLQTLQDAVRRADDFITAQSHDRLIRLPTGDGMALVFFGDAEAPLRCALQLSEMLKELPDIRLRMGIHSGPVYRMADINANLNVAGGGINMAQRVMDCGDAGHILVSKPVADVLAHVSTWDGMLHYLGEVEVKHGVKIHILNLYTEVAGNSAVPQKLHLAWQAEQTVLIGKKRKKLSYVIGGIAIAAAAGIFGWATYSRAHTLTEKDTVVLCDFTNTTGDSTFDGALKQGLLSGLGQTPFLNILSNDNVSQQLRYMGRSADERLTPAVARDVCRRSGSKAMLVGSISSLGSHYVIGLNAVNCQTGDLLGGEQSEADSREHVLPALSDAQSKIRQKLGESLASVQKYDTPVEEATTPSLDALKAYSEGIRVVDQQGDGAGLPFFKRAIELDPNFALAYNKLGISYGNLRQDGLAADNLKKAYDLRERATEPEKYEISAKYYSRGTGELEKANQVFQEWAAAYPRKDTPWVNLAFNHMLFGQYEQGVVESQRSLRIDPDSVQVYVNLFNLYVALGRLDDAKKLYKEAQTRNLEDPALHANRYGVAFLDKDPVEMQKQVDWATGKAGIESVLLSVQSDTEAYAGHLEKSRELSRRSVDSDKGNDSRESAAEWLLKTALIEAEIGNTATANRDATAALALGSTRDTRTLAALVFARSAATGQAETIADDLNKLSPLHTMLNGYWLPTIRAAIELDHKHPDKALAELEAASAYELGYPQPQITCGGMLYPIYIRGEAYLQAGKGREAAAEFQKIIDHRTIVQNFILGALAHLQLGRAKAVVGDKADAAKAYDEFFSLWKDADSDAPILKQAKTEYAKLK